jgi:tetratricopeptide (TPR) repeat protein
MQFAVAVVLPPDHHDISGGAFHEVAEALHHGLLALGHDSVLTNRLDLDDRRTIVLGSNLLVQYALEPPKNPIFYNLEQLGDDLPWMTMPEFVDLFRRYPNWDYSQANVEYLAGLGLPRPAYVPIAYVPQLTRIAPAAEDIDVLFYGALNGRRYAVLRELRERGLRVKWLPGVYGASRDAWIARSKVVLNLHYFEAKIFAIVRISYLLANRRAVVSEHSADPTLEGDLASGIAFADYDELVDRCVELVGDESERRELAERGYEAFSARDQSAILDRALADLKGAVHKTTRKSSRSDVRLNGKDRSAEDRLRERQLFTRNLFKHKSAQERDWLLAKIKRNPEDARSIFFLAETYFRMDDFVNARKWYARRVEMGGCDEEAYWALYRLAQLIQQVGTPWPECEDAYLRAFYFRPTRAEPLYAVASAYHAMERYQVGYLIAQRAADLPVPDEDLFVPGEVEQVYAWRASDEQATCAFWIGKHAEAFTLCRGLLARSDIPDPDRQRIAANRDFSVPAMIEAATPYPEALVQSLTANPGTAEVTVTLIAGPNRHTTEQTINSFLNCSLDVSRVGRFLLLDTGLSTPDRELLQQRYGFLKFADAIAGDKPAAQLSALRAQIDGRFWLHLGEGWRFFAPDNYITRLTAVLDTEPEVFQVGINFADAVKPTGATAAEQTIRRTPDTGRYLLTEAMTTGPAMFDTTRLDRALGVQDSTGLRTASLDEVLCISSQHQ